MTIYDPDSGTGFIVTGTAYSAIEWKKRMDAAGHKVSSLAQKALLEPDYDLNHRLEEGKKYMVRLLFGREIREDSKRTTSKIKSFAERKYGEHACSHLKAEFAFLLRQELTNKDLEDMGIWRIVVLHEPIMADEPSMFRIDRFDGVSSVSVEWGNSKTKWGGGVAFAFPMLNG
jgi:hypothetical protein